MTASPHRRPRALVLAVALVGALVTPRSAHADDASRAEELFKAGRTALDKGDYPEACARFAESLKINPRPSVSFNLAGCETHEGRLTAARRHWQEGLAAIDAKDPRATVANEKIAELDKRIPRLTIRVPAGGSTGATVKLDGIAVEAGVALPTDPGEHVAVLTATGQQESRQTFVVAEGEQKEVTLAPPLASVPGEVAPGPADRDAGRRTRRLVGFVATGVGVAGALGAAITGGLLLSRDGTIHTDCPDKHCTAAGLSTIQGSNHLIVGNYVTWGLAIAGLGAGVPLLVTSRPEAKVTVGLGATGLLVSGSFR